MHRIAYEGSCLVYLLASMSISHDALAITTLQNEFRLVSRSRIEMAGGSVFDDGDSQLVPGSVPGTDTSLSTNTHVAGFGSEVLASGTSVLNYNSPTTGSIELDDFLWQTTGWVSAPRGNTSVSIATNFLYRFILDSPGQISVNFSLPAQVQQDSRLYAFAQIASTVDSELFETRGPSISANFEHELQAGVEYTMRVGTNGSAAGGGSDLPGNGQIGSGTISWEIAEFCPVGRLDQSLFPKPNDPPQPQPQYLFVNDLPQRVAEFERLIRLVDPNATFEVKSAYRSAQYQAHFNDIKMKWDSFTNNDRKKVQNAVPIQNGQLVPNMNDPEHVACLACIHEVNDEKQLHELGINSKNRLSLSDSSAHTKGTAVDISVGSSDPQLSQDTIDGVLDELAAGAGLFRPHIATNPHERTHYQINGSPISYGAQFTGESPINLLVEDPLGRRLGFDPATSQVVNDFGDEAWYSGAGSEPQVLQLPSGSVVDGNYKVTGIGTDNGPYTIRSFLFADDPENKLQEQVLATGIASLNEQLSPVQKQFFASGDYNRDGSVGLEDYALWKSDFGSSLVDADGNHNGVVDAADYTVWRNNLASGSGSFANVPEPNTTLLAAIATAFVGLCAKRRNAFIT